jgi:site-specific DNA recombinase
MYQGFIAKKRVVNDGIAPQYYVKGCHEAIISKDVFLKVQEEISRRGSLKKGKRIRAYSSKYALSNMVHCDCCGDVFRRVHWHTGGKKKVVWRCASKLERGSTECDSRTILEEDLKGVIVKGINKLLIGKDEYVEVLKKNIEVILGESNDEIIGEIDGKLKVLQTELLKLVGEKQGYDKLTNEILKLNGLKEKAMIRKKVNCEAREASLGYAGRDGQRKRIDDVIEFMEGCSGSVYAFDEMLVRRLIDRVVVKADGVKVEFKSGVEIEF